MKVQQGEILCIHYYFPPLDSTATIRNYNVVKALSSFYSKVHVLTSDNHKRFPTQKNTCRQMSVALTYILLIIGYS